MRLFLATALLVLTGCAGTNFVRPDTDAFRNGRTTYKEVIAKMGAPWREGTAIKNEKSVKSSSYAYASVGGKSLNPGVTAARGIDFFFHNDILVGHVFTSSWAEDNTNFDEKKAQNIVKGKTTRAEVVQMLGKPAGSYIHPMVKAPTGDAAVYLFVETRGFTHFKKSLVVTFDPAGIANEIEYESVGTQ